MNKWKVFRVFVENEPDVWMVSSKAFKGDVKGHFKTEEDARRFAGMLNNRKARNSRGARLHASAPALLEVVKAFREYLSVSNQAKDTLEKITALIAHVEEKIR